MNDEASREEFEQWFVSNHGFSSLDEPEGRNAWAGWQAGIELQKHLTDTLKKALDGQIKSHNEFVAEVDTRMKDLMQLMEGKK